MKCPKCGYRFPKELPLKLAGHLGQPDAAFAAKVLGSITSPLKASAARQNGKLGGRPFGSKNKPKSQPA